MQTSEFSFKLLKDKLCNFIKKNIKFTHSLNMVLKD